MNDNYLKKAQETIKKANEIVEVIFDKEKE